MLTRRLGPVRHTARRLSSRAADARSTERGLRLGVPRVLSMGSHRASIALSRHAQAPGETLLLRRRLEKVRASMGPDDPYATTTHVTPLLEGVLSKVTERGSIKSYAR